METQIISIFITVVVIALIFLPAIICWKLITKSTNKAISQNPISLETIPEEFEKIYKELYHSHIHSLEVMRKNVRWRYILAGICFFLGWIFTGITNETGTVLLGITGLMLFGIGILLVYNSVKYSKKYKETYKKDIISNFIKLINNQLEYTPLDTGSFRTLDYYKQAEFDNRKFNRFYPDDYIEGYLEEGTFVQMCDLHIQNETGSGKNRTVVELFQGIFAHTRCSKDIGTYIKISKNKSKILEKQDRIEMDSEEFEKYFDVYSENKIVAMQLLTSDIMEIFIDFHKKYGINYEIVFRGNIIYTRFSTGIMFEPTIFGNSMDKRELFRYYCLLKFIIEVIQKVNKIKQETEV